MRAASVGGLRVGTTGGPINPDHRYYLILGVSPLAYHLVGMKMYSNADNTNQDTPLHEMT